MITLLRIATALVWIIFGLIFKVLNLVPRHQMIVATILGPDWARPLTLLIGLAEIGMGLWILSGYRPRLCATAQTLAIVGMNSLELGLARDLLLAPWLMVVANTILLSLVWYTALNSGKAR